MMIQKNYLNVNKEHILNINIVCIGKIKDKYIIDGINEFLKRMQSFAKMKIVELKQDGYDSNRNLSIEKESEDIIYYQIFREKTILLKRWLAKQRK